METNIIKEARIKMGMSMDEVAEYLGLPVAVYVYIEGHFDACDAYLCKRVCVMMAVDFDLI